MRKLIFSVSVTFLFYSCGSVNLKDSVPAGRYNIKDLTYYEELELREDGTFELTVKQPHVTKSCKGEWLVKSEKELLLNGSDTRNFEEADSLFYEKLNCSDLILEFESLKKIKRDNYYLKRMK